jgi:large subunit ribosomal protein L22
MDGVLLRRMAGLALSTSARHRGSSSLASSHLQRQFNDQRQLGISTTARGLSAQPNDVSWTWFRSNQRSHYFSSKALEVPLPNDNDAKLSSEELSPITANMLTDPASGKTYGMLMDTRKLPKLKPYIVKRRLARMKTYVGTEKGIRQSPWKLNLICQLAAGLTLEEALTQLQFCDKKNADLVAKVLKRTSNLSDIKDGLQMSQLEVAECFATKGMMLKRIKLMGRGR